MDGVGIISIAITAIWIDVANCEDIELLSWWICVAGCIGREQYRPGDETANKGYNDRDLQVTKQEEAIQRVVLQDISIRNSGSAA